MSIEFKVFKNELQCWNMPRCSMHQLPKQPSGPDRSLKKTMRIMYNCLNRPTQTLRISPKPNLH